MNGFEIPEGMYLKGHKIKIYPTEEEKKLIDNRIDLRRYVYNWAINEEYKQYDLWVLDFAPRKMLSKFDLYKMYTKFKQSPGQEFLLDFPIDSARSAIDGAFRAFDKFYKHQAKNPKFRSKKNCRLFASYGIRSDRLFFKGKYVRIPGFKKGTKVYIGYESGFNCQKDNPTYYNSFVSRDRLGNYWLSFKTMEPKLTNYFIENNIPEMKEDFGVIGIDLNKESRFVCSDNSKYKSPNISRLLYKKKELQRRIQKDNDRLIKQEKTNPGVELRVSKRSEKRRDQYRKVEYKIRCINNNFIQNVTKDIVKKHPKMVVMENLNVTDMIKNKFAASKTDFHFASFFKCRYTMQRKCDLYGIRFELVPRSFPSSKLCSNCCFIYNHKFLKNRQYICPACGLEIDRDINAAYNLRNYGIKLLQET